MFVSDDFLFVGKVEPYFLSAGEEKRHFFLSLQLMGLLIISDKNIVVEKKWPGYFIIHL